MTKKFALASLALVCSFALVAATQSKSATENRRFIKLGEFAGDARQFTVKKDSLRGVEADAAAALVQAGNAERPTTILGAAIATLH